jgi:hypothetical protein
VQVCTCIQVCKCVYTCVFTCMHAMQQRIFLYIYFHYHRAPITATKQNICHLLDTEVISNYTSLGALVCAVFPDIVKEVGTAVKTLRILREAADFSSCISLYVYRFLCVKSCVLLPCL